MKTFVAEILELQEAEVEEVNEQKGKADGSNQGPNPGASASVGDAESGREKLIGTLTASGVQQVVVDKLGSDDLDLVMKKREDAKVRVMTYVTLIVDEGSESKLGKEISKTTVGKLRGTVKVTGY